MELSKKRWIILGASCLINLCIGSLYAWSVFASPMAHYLSSVGRLTLTAANLAIVFTVSNISGPITMIYGGKINDTFGPKKVIFVGGIVFGAGTFLSGFAQSVGFLIFSYGILNGIGMGMIYGCTIGNSIKFFPDKRGMIGGVTTAFYGLSTVIISPIANALITSVGATSAFKILGVTFLIVICISSFFVEKCPADFAPKGWRPPATQNGVSEKVEMDWKGMLKSPKFYVMISILICGACSGLMCVSQASSVSQKMVGMSTVAASTAVSILALFNAVGRIIAGYISDRIGRINTLTAAFVLTIIGLGCLYISGKGDIITFYIGISIIGVCFGSFMGVFPGFTADQFGAKNNSVNYGIMFIGFALAGFLGPTIMSNIYNVDNSYQRAFLIAGCVGFVGLALSFVYRIIEKKKTYLNTIRADVDI